MDKPKLVGGTQEGKVVAENKKVDALKAEVKAPSKPDAQGITQREAVYIEVMRVIRENKIVVAEGQAVKPLLSETHIKNICAALVAGFQAKKIALKDTEANKQKLADAKQMGLYCLGLLNNWIRRDKRLNGTLNGKK